VAEAGGVAGFPGTEPVSNAELLEQPCDILVPAAIGSQIREDNADRIKATIVAEGANGPTTPEADAILRDRGVTVIPDILAIAGGTRPGVAEARGRDLRRRLVHEDPADPVRLLRLDDDLEVPVVVVADRRPVPL